MLGSNGLCRETKKSIASWQSVVVWGRAEKGTELGGKIEKDRGIPETEVPEMIPIAVIPRVTNNTPANP